MNIDEITYENLGRALIDAIPEVERGYRDELQWWGDDQPGQHVIFGDIFFPYIVRLCGSEGAEKNIRRAFDFIEELANHRDEKIQEVVAVTLCEDICANELVLQKAQKYMGEKTRRYCTVILGKKK